MTLSPFSLLMVSESCFCNFRSLNTNILGGYHCLLGMWVGTLTRYRTHGHGEDDDFNYYLNLSQNSVLLELYIIIPSQLQFE